MKLQIDLLPPNAWGQNMRTTLSSKDWDRLRKNSYKRASYACEICGAEGKLHAHEVWCFDDIEKTQTLEKIIAVCKSCHAVIHWGRTECVSTQKEIAYLIGHWCTVNATEKSLTIADFTEHRNKAFALWSNRGDTHYQLVHAKEENK